MKTTAIYARCSTDKQKLDMQIDECVNFAKSKKLKYKLFNDFGFSGAAITRPALDKLKKEARAGKINHIIFYKLDRLYRDTVRALTFINEMRKLGVKLIFIRDGINSIETPTDELLASIIAVLATHERAILKQRTRDGIKAYRKAGNHWGRPTFETKFPEKVDLILKLKKEGLSQYQINKKTKTHRDIIRRILKTDKERQG